MWFALLVFYLRKPCLSPGCKDFSPRLSSGHFIVLTMSCMSLIHFELISGYAVRQRFNVHLRISSFPKINCWRLSFLPMNCLIGGNCLTGASHSNFRLGCDRKRYSLRVDFVLSFFFPPEKSSLAKIPSQGPEFFPFSTRSTKRAPLGNLAQSGLKLLIPGQSL